MSESADCCHACIEDICGDRCYWCTAETVHTKLVTMLISWSCQSVLFFTVCPLSLDGEYVRSSESETEYSSSRLILGLVIALPTVILCRTGYFVVVSQGADY